LTLYQLTLLTAFSALMLPRMGVATPVDAGWIVFNGVSNAIGQYWWTRALRPRRLGGGAVLLSRWSGRAFWASRSGAMCPPFLVIGSGVVVASGLFLRGAGNSRRRSCPRPGPEPRPADRLPR
jgi:hypothetical protein